ncbi:HD-GYP domain-containing protein [Pseudothermotoga thermarum]|uniref:Metal dependent phosphohydrolase n=1 Tax=Pseudothermotoga thermarum DSM 5069 TaxID=688269 RepID=F7YWI4_9THEM|nr:HD-GYP domain-containing protein [Pseudothermotoga thermarum]AEH51965.1 metal dependent phosphohydrolase [Pseudothermotoga thermarum DSM 5069]
MDQKQGQTVWKKVSFLVPGDISLETIKSPKDGETLVKAGQILTREDILRLLENDVNYLWVMVQPANPPVVEAKRIEKTKEEIKNIFNKVVESMKIETEEVRQLSDQILSDIERNYSDKMSLIFFIQESDEEYTYVHEVHVGMISSLIGIELGMKHSELADLCFSAMIHDVGKVLVPKPVLYAQRKLTPEEFEIVKKHVLYGEKLCRASGITNELVISGVRNHHEKLDGSGYLAGLKGSEITSFARIIAVADIYDALISQRSYKTPWSPYKAISELISMASTGKLDGKVVRAFVSIVGLYPVGTTVILNNGVKATVVGNTRKVITRPIVRLEDGTKVDLSEEKSLTIVQVLD